MRDRVSSRPARTMAEEDATSPRLIRLGQMTGARERPGHRWGQGTTTVARIQG